MTDISVEDLRTIREKAEQIKAIADKYLTPPAPAPLYRVRVTAAGLNVRGGPGTSFPVLGSVPRDAELDVYAVDAASGWLKVTVDEERWVSGNGAFSVRV